MISAILLAAGQSKRMKGKNKLIKQINGYPLIKYSVNNILNSSIDKLIIILGHDDDKIRKAINKNKKIKFVYNEYFDTGIASSIKVGINNLEKETRAFFVCLGDMPNVSKEIYNKLIISMLDNEEKEIFVPYYNEKQANPILFSITMKTMLNSITGDTGAKKIISDNHNKVFELKTTKKEVVTDYNYPKDFIKNNYTHEKK